MGRAKTVYFFKRKSTKNGGAIARGKTSTAAAAGKKLKKH